MDWRVEFHRDFVPEFRALAESVQDEIAALVEKMRVIGPIMETAGIGYVRWFALLEYEGTSLRGRQRRMASCLCVRPNPQSNFARCW